MINRLMNRPLSPGDCWWFDRPCDEVAWRLRHARTLGEKGDLVLEGADDMERGGSSCVYVPIVPGTPYEPEPNPFAGIVFDGEAEPVPFTREMMVEALRVSMECRSCV